MLISEKHVLSKLIVNGRVRDQHPVKLDAPIPFSRVAGTNPLDCAMAREPGRVELSNVFGRRRTSRSAWRCGFQPSVCM
jgi:hypothetical protein